MNRTHRTMAWAGELPPRTILAPFAMGLCFYGFAFSLTLLDRLPPMPIIAEARAEWRTIETLEVPVPATTEAIVIDARESVDDWSCRAGC